MKMFEHILMLLIAAVSIYLVYGITTQKKIGISAQVNESVFRVFNKIEKFISNKAAADQSPTAEPSFEDSTGEADELSQDDREFLEKLKNELSGEKEITYEPAVQELVDFAHDVRSENIKILEVREYNRFKVIDAEDPDKNRVYVLYGTEGIEEKIVKVYTQAPQEGFASIDFYSNGLIKRIARKISGLPDQEVEFSQTGMVKNTTKLSEEN